MANPAKNAASVASRRPGAARRSAAIAGSAGRYMSIDSGPIALTDPSTTMSRVTLGTASTLRAA